MIFDRSHFIETLASLLNKREDVLALWQCGSAAFSRTDQFSDIDIEAVVTAGSIETVTRYIKSAINSITPIAQEARLVHEREVQYYWQLLRISRFAVVDLTLSEFRPGGYTIDTSIHSKPIVHFNRCEALRFCEESAQQREERVQSVRAHAEAFGWLHPIWVEKHIKRGNRLQAYGEYQRSMIRPLIDLLRAKHCPQRSSWQTTYITFDLPPEVNARLERLMLVNILEEMHRNLPEVSEWRRELLTELQAETVIVEPAGAADAAPRAADL